jgi:hypothetical protein
MDTIQFDQEIDELIATGQVDEAERWLLNHYEKMKSRQDKALLVHAATSLEHFYALPLKEDVVKAETILSRERFELTRCLASNE